jgi:TolA-binding protein
VAPAPRPVGPTSPPPSAPPRAPAPRAALPSPAAPSSAPPAAEPPRSEEADYAEAASARDPRAAIRLFDALARRRGRLAEIAALRAARLMASLDPAAGVRRFESFVADHPTSAFDAEARLYLIEGRVRVAGLAAAERDVESFLDRHRDNERRSEALFLRAEIRRKVHGRCDEAARDYAAAAASPRVAEDALYFEASCRRQLGAHEEARRGFVRYLERYPRGRHAASARAAVQAAAGQRR